VTGCCCQATAVRGGGDLFMTAHPAAAPESAAAPASHARQDSYISLARLAAQWRQQEQRPPASAQSSGEAMMCYSHSYVLNSFIW
jgi:hypothetical protein